MHSVRLSILEVKGWNSWVHGISHILLDPEMPSLRMLRMLTGRRYKLGETRKLPTLVELIVYKSIVVLNSKINRPF